LWVNGLLRMEYLIQPMGTAPWAQIQVPTVFRAPLRDQTEYFWDFLIWKAQ
jgi:hypothetical protein